VIRPAAWLKAFSGEIFQIENTVVEKLLVSETEDKRNIKL